MDIEEVLQDNPNRKVVRIGDTVRRPTHPWTPTIHALLTYLEQVGFTYSPRVLGFDDQGREMLTYIEGESGADGWAKVVDERGLDAFARLLREYHEVIAGFHPADHAVWATGATAPLGSNIICHGDFGPWNVVWHDLKPVGLIDWDYARPAPSSFDVAYALEYVAPFRDDAQCLRWLRYSTAPDRSSRLRRFIEAYGEDPSIDWAEKVIACQRDGLGLARKLADNGNEPQLTWAANGYLDDVENQVRWSERHRHLFTQVEIDRQ